MRRLMRITLGGAAALVLSVGVLPLLDSSVAQAAGPDPQGTIYVADYGAGAIKIFAPGSNGNVAPERVISGSNTGLSLPGDVKVDALGDIYVANLEGGSVEEFAPGAT